MNRNDFNEIVKNSLFRSEDILIKKQKEYSVNDNVLSNFERAAKISGHSPEKVLWMFMLKHYTSLSDIVDSIDKNQEYPTIELFREKSTDVINYLILLEAMILNNKNKQ